MDGVDLFAAAAGAFALPSWFVLARLDAPSRRAWIGPARGLLGSLYVIWAVNVASLLWGEGWTSAAWFVAMNLGFLGSAAAGWFSYQTASVLVNRRPDARHITVFSSGVVLLWLVGLYRSFLLVADGGPPVFRYGEVFTMGTLAGAGALIVTAVTLVRGRKLLPDPVRKELGWVLGIFGVLGVWSVLADVFVLDERILGRDLPMSPFFLVAVALVVYRALEGLWGHLVPAEVPADFDSWCRSRGISEREAAVLRLVGAGQDRAAIAAALFISPITVKNHVAALYRKTGTSDQASLTSLARTNGL